MSIEQEPIRELPRVVAEPVMVAPVVEPGVVVPPLVRETVATTTSRQYAFDSFIVGIVGLAVLIVGLIAITRGGFDGPMNDPIVSVVGFTHTTTLGLIEAGIGLCLLLAAAARSRAAAIFFGLVLGVGGIVGAVQTDSFSNSLALESGLAWLAVALGLIVVLASLIVPRTTTKSAHVESI